MTVSVVANPLNSLETTVPEGRWGLPLAEYPTATFEVDDGDTLATVIGRAVHEVVNEVPPHYLPQHEAVTFATADDHQAFRARPYGSMSELVLVDESGHAVWVYDWSEVSVEQLQRSADAGTLAGDPLHPIVVVEKPAGNGYFLEWSEFVDALRILDAAVGEVAKYGGALAAAKLAYDLLKARVERALAAVDAQQSDWAERRARPKSFQRFLIQRPWRTSELAELLDCTEEQAEGALLAFGLTPDDEGRWHLGGDNEAWFMGQVFDLALGLRMSEDQRKQLRKRVGAYLSTGSWQTVIPDDDDLESAAAEIASVDEEEEAAGETGVPEEGQELLAAVRQQLGDEWLEEAGSWRVEITERRDAVLHTGKWISFMWGKNESEGMLLAVNRAQKPAQISLVQEDGTFEYLGPVDGEF